MRAFRSRRLDRLTLDEAWQRLAFHEGITMMGRALLPEADIIRCRIQEKEFNIKFDLAYGISLDFIGDFTEREVETILSLLADPE